MAYRFTNTDKWNDSWFSGLKPIEKLLFIYLCDNCDIAGFVEINLKRWASDINSDKKTIEGALKGLQRGLTNSKTGDCIFINNFLKHQKNIPINPLNQAHKGIISRFNFYLYKFDCINYIDFLEGVSKGHLSPIGNGNGIGNGLEGKEGVEEKPKKKFIVPSLEEVKQFFKEKGYTQESAIKAWNHYNFASWHDTTGKPVLNWKQKMNTVWFKEENKIKVDFNPKIKPLPPP